MGEEILYTGADLIDGTGAPLRRNISLLVSGDRIARICESAKGISGNARIVDLRGKTVTPGLINSHVHILLEPVGDPFAVLLRESRVKTALRGAANLLKYLRSGVTYIRDMGGCDFIDIELKKCLQDGSIPGPGMMASGRMLTMTGGQCHVIGRECDGPDEVTKAAREQLKAGADFVKVMATGGVMTPGSRPGTAQMTMEEMRTAVETAHRADRKVAAHVQGREGAMNALLAGVDTIEHGVFLDDELVGMMAERGTWLIPTLSAPHFIIRYGEENGVPGFVVEKTRRITDNHLESIRRAAKAGVRIVMGTDSGTPFNSHDRSPYELALMVEAGLSPMEALRSATGMAAEMMGIADSHGTVAEGKKADFLVLNKNPLEDIGAFLDIHSIYQNGILVGGTAAGAGPGSGAGQIGCVGLAGGDK